MHAFIKDIKQFNIIYTLKWYENMKMTEMTQVVHFAYLDTYIVCQTYVLTPG